MIVLLLLTYYLIEITLDPGIFLSIAEDSIPKAVSVANSIL
jgi:hypothetical protein